MSLPERHERNCDKCGGAMWLRHKKSDNTPFYSCGNWKPVDQGGKACKNIYNVDAPKQQPTGNETFRTSKIECPECHCHIIVDVHASSLGVVKKKQHAPTIKEYAGVEESTEDAPDDDIPF